MKQFYAFLTLLIVWGLGLAAHEQDLLKSSDVSRVMKQILEHHIEKKEITDKIFRHSLSSYLDQFDTRRIYLLENEVSPFVSLSEQKLKLLIDQYKQSDYSIFVQLNTVIQQSIKRSRLLRKEIEKNPALFQFKNKNDSSANNSEQVIGYVSFANNVDQLKRRIEEDLENYIRQQRTRYSDVAVLEKKDEILASYEARLRDFESGYLFEDDRGASLPTPEKENLFTIHILKALASSLDAHTSFYQNNEAYDLRVRLEKEFKGVGLVLKDNSDGITVNGMLPGSASEKSGLIRIGDILLKVDGEDVSSHAFDKVMDMLHDSNNPEMILVFKHKDTNKDAEEQAFTVKLKREMIIVNNDRVDSEYEHFGNGIIGKIALHSFYQGEGISSEKDVREAIQKLQAKGNLKGLILDLRDNSGGFLSQAIKVAGLFITNGIIVISKYSDGEEKIYRDVDGKRIYDGPLIILTSKITASAAEIVAQALQDYGVALVVGDEHTYGKGTIQSQTVTDNGSSSYFKVTVGKYYTVSGKTPQKEGVKADVVVPGHWNDEMIGEEYLDSMGADKISPHFNDTLSDISPDIRSWYLKYYTPKLQTRRTDWRNMLNTLKKNSEYRIAHNKNYQFYLKGGKSTEKTEEPGLETEEEELTALDSKNKNFGEDDLQMKEAVNILKDMVLLHSLGIPTESDHFDMKK